MTFPSDVEWVLMNSQDESLATGTNCDITSNNINMVSTVKW
jgi:hypothetical protein